MVDATWRRKRAILIETTLFDLEISEHEEETAKDFGETATGPLRLALAFRNRHGDGVWDALQRLLNLADRCYSRALRDLEKLQQDRFNQMQPPPPADEAGEDRSTPKIVEITKRSHRDAAPAPQQLEPGDLDVDNEEDDADRVPKPKVA